MFPCRCYSRHRLQSSDQVELGILYDSVTGREYGCLGFLLPTHCACAAAPSGREGYVLDCSLQRLQRIRPNTTRLVATRLWSQPRSQPCVLEKATGLPFASSDIFAPYKCVGNIFLNSISHPREDHGRFQKEKGCHKWSHAAHDAVDRKKNKKTPIYGLLQIKVKLGLRRPMTVSGDLQTPRTDVTTRA